MGDREHAEIKRIFLYMGLCVSIIFFNGYVRCHCGDGTDLLMTKLGVWDLDGWSLTHFTFFAIMGYLFPTHFWLLTALGVSWELLEHLMGRKRPSWMGGFGDCQLTTDQIDSTHKDWWFGRESDILMNVLGLFVGMKMRKR